MSNVNDKKMVDEIISSLDEAEEEREISASIEMFYNLFMPEGKRLLKHKNCGKIVLLKIPEEENQEEEDTHIKEPGVSLVLGAGGDFKATLITDPETETIEKYLRLPEGEEIIMEEDEEDVIYH